jgi:hypothetical protein
MLALAWFLVIEISGTVPVAAWPLVMVAVRRFRPRPVGFLAWAFSPVSISIVILI